MSGAERFMAAMLELPGPDDRWCSNCQYIVPGTDRCTTCDEPTSGLPAGHHAPLVVQQQVDELLAEVARLHLEVQAARPDVTWHCASSDCHRGHDSDYVGGHRNICLVCSTEEHEVEWFRCEVPVVSGGSGASGETP